MSEAYKAENAHLFPLSVNAKRAFLGELTPGYYNYTPRLSITIMTWCLNSSPVSCQNIPLASFKPHKDYLEVKKKKNETAPEKWFSG